MGARLIELAVGLGVLVSAVILAAMLLAPFLPASAPPPTPPTPTASPAGSADPSEEAARPPVGTYRLRGTLAFSGACLGLVLDEDSYPATDAASGTAIVLTWLSPIADSANPAACASRTGELRREEVAVERVSEPDGPDDRLVGYAVRAPLPVAVEGSGNVEIVILAAQRSPDVVQAIDMTTSGGGLVFERVAEIDPPLAPTVSASPTSVALPSALFLLRGPIQVDGPCLVLDLRASAVPPGPGTEGTASIRWWEPGGDDPDDPAFCLSRAGEVQTGPARIEPVRRDGDPSGLVLGYTIRFALTASDGSGSSEVALYLPGDQLTPDQLVATDLAAEDGPALVFDRVDAIDPSLVPAP